MTDFNRFKFTQIFLILKIYVVKRNKW